MSHGEIVLLGGIAGLTIFLGLPVGRVSPPPGLRSLLTAIAIGILLFLFWDVVSHAVEPIEEALTDATGGGSWGRFAGLAAIAAATFAAGLLGLVLFAQRAGRRHAGHRQLALLIATGIGLHNFAEGLAIGQSAAGGAIALALLLVVGFGLHNATEGFGIVAPLAADETRPSWGFLALLGLIGGGPTVVGTAIGQTWVSDAASVAFLGLAAGSILYVVVELLAVGRAVGGKQALATGVLVGLVLGFATDFVLVAAGA